MNISEQPSIPQLTQQQLQPQYSGTTTTTTNITDLPKSTLEQNTINKLISGLQEVSNSGITKLHSRDIPQNTEHIIKDPHVTPDYIEEPKPEKKDYINEDLNNVNVVVNNYQKNKKQKDDLEEVYNELQLPILIGIFYFIFQLPVYKKYLKIIFPIMFYRDGLINFYGHFFTSMLFSITYYFFYKIFNYMKI
jgi:hypothetical protein